MDLLEGKMASASKLDRGGDERGRGGTVNPPGDGRRRGRGNPPLAARTVTAHPISTKLQQIAALARQAPEMSFTSLAHMIDMDWLKEAYRRTRKDGATGVDGRTAQEYAEKLDTALADLLERVKSGVYRAPAVRRVHVPKGTGNDTRPISIPTFEDKVLQRAVLMVLEAIYEEDFVDCSYGFRPGRSPHKALESLRDQIMEIRGGWILDVDVRRFFDTLEHGHLREMLRRRVRDGVLLRLIGKWLNAGVLEDGQLSFPEAGTPQGGVVSPVLANVYLHEVLDVWFEQEVKPRLRGRAFLVRYCDDFVIGFEREDDARRVEAVLPKRFGRFGLELHPTKTRLLDFRRPRLAKRPTGIRCSDGLVNFDFLGFTHFWGRSRKGNWVVQRQTSKDRFSRALRRVSAYCRAMRHRPVSEQHEALKRKLVGHYAYYGVTGNARRVSSFRWEVGRIWHKWLNRRSQRRTMTWAKFTKLTERYPLPPARIVHAFDRHAANA
jgi:RNA-directed DNA polymerase